MNVGLRVIMYHEHAGQYLQRTEEDARSTGTGVTDSVSRHHVGARNRARFQQSVVFTAKKSPHGLGQPFPYPIYAFVLFLL